MENSVQNDVNETLGGDALRDYRMNKKSQKSQPSESSSNPDNIQRPRELKNLQISDGRSFENRRLRDLNMIRSPTQRKTPGVGNCFIEAIADQTRYIL